MEFCLLLKICVKKISKNISTSLNGKYSQNLLDYAKKSATERAIQKAAEEIGDLIGNKITNKITKLSKNSQKERNSETGTNDNDKEIPKERYISPEER